MEPFEPFEPSWLDSKKSNFGYYFTPPHRTSKFGIKNAPGLPTKAPSF